MLPLSLGSYVESVADFTRQNMVLNNYDVVATSYVSQKVVIDIPIGVYDLKSLSVCFEAERNAGTVIPANMDVMPFKNLRVYLGTQLVSEIIHFNQLQQVLRSWTWNEGKRRTYALGKNADGAKTIATAELPLGFVLNDFVGFKSDIIDLELLGQPLKIELDVETYRIFGGMTGATAYFKFINSYSSVDKILFRTDAYRAMVRKALESGGVEYEFKTAVGFRNVVPDLSQDTELWVSGHNLEFLVATVLEDDFDTITNTPSTIYGNDLTYYSKKTGSAINTAQLFIAGSAVHQTPIDYWAIPSWNSRQLQDKAGNYLLVEQDYYDHWAFFQRLNINDDDYRRSGIDTKGVAIPFRFRTSLYSGATAGTSTILMWVIKSVVVRAGKAGYEIIL